MRHGIIALLDDSGASRICLLYTSYTCPAGCYSLNDKGQVEITVDGCFECGTCRVLTAKTGEIEWEYPRGGYGLSLIHI